MTRNRCGTRAVMAVVMSIALLMTACSPKELNETTRVETTGAQVQQTTASKESTAPTSESTVGLEGLEVMMNQFSEVLEIINAGESDITDFAYYDDLMVITLLNMPLAEIQLESVMHGLKNTWRSEGLTLPMGDGTYTSQMEESGGIYTFSQKIKYTSGEVTLIDAVFDAKRYVFEYTKSSVDGETRIQYGMPASDQFIISYSRGDVLLNQQDQLLLYAKSEDVHYQRRLEKDKKNAVLAYDLVKSMPSGQEEFFEGFEFGTKMDLVNGKMTFVRN